MSLYERLGQEPGIRATIDDSCPGVVCDAELAALTANRDDMVAAARPVH